MAVVKSHSRIAFEKGRFDHHEVRVPDVLDQAVGRFRVAHDDELHVLESIVLPSARITGRPSARSLRTGPSGTPKAVRRSGRRCRRTWLSNENAKLSVSRWRTRKQSTVNSPAS